MFQHEKLYPEGITVPPRGPIRICPVLSKSPCWKCWLHSTEDPLAVNPCLRKATSHFFPKSVSLGNLQNENGRFWRVQVATALIPTVGATCVKFAGQCYTSNICFISTIAFLCHLSHLSQCYGIWLIKSQFIAGCTPAGAVNIGLG